MHPSSYKLFILFSLLTVTLTLFPLSSSAQNSTERTMTSTLLLSSKNKKDAIINKAKLSKIFSGRQRTWRQNLTVQIVLLPEGSPEMKWLSERVLKMPESLLRRFIYQRVYRGIMKPPIEVQTSEDAIQILKKTPGAIAPVIITSTETHSKSFSKNHILLVRSN